MKHEIKIYEPIGGHYGIQAATIVEGIPADATEIIVRIHSPGGSVGDGIAIYNALRDHPADVTTIVDGYAASIASVIMLAGDEVRVHKSSLIFIHNPFTTTQGDSKELRKVADDLDLHGRQILEIYKDHTGKTTEELAQMLDDETWMTGQMAIENGFAGVLIDDPEEEKAIAAMLRIEGMAAQHRSGNMSAQKTRKEIEAAHADLQKKHEAVAAKVAETEASMEKMQSEHAAEVQGIEAKHATEIEALNAEVEAKAKEVEAKDAELAELRASMESMKAEHEAANAKVDGLEAKLSETEGNLEAAEVKLSNPAFVHASGEGHLTPVADGGEGNDGNQTPHMTEYSQIEDPSLKSKYWNEHKAEIEQEMKQASGK